MGGGFKVPSDCCVKIEQQEERLGIAQDYHQHAANTTGKLTSSSEPYMVHQSSSAFQRLKKLNSNGILVLFTPAVAAPPGEAATNRMDPFEPLGRALSKEHNKIRHVPYVPSVGFTDTHFQFLERADAIMVVVCAVVITPKPEPDSKASPPSSVATPLQLLFAAAVQRALQAGHRDIPTVLLLTGPELRTEIRRCEDQINEFHVTVAVESYEKDALIKVPELLFAWKH